MNKKKIITSLLSLSTVTLLAACSTNDGETSTPVESVESQSVVVESNMEESNSMSSMSSMEESGHDMVHDESGDIPEGLKISQTPTYQVGDKVEVLTDHMEGMEGAEATVVGAFDTIAYEISYDPVDGGPRVENHKWVIHEEIEEAKEVPFEPGTEVKIKANHMEGMEGATATIEASDKTTVYMIDYQPTTGGPEIKNHKWVTDMELSVE